MISTKSLLTKPSRCLFKKRLSRKYTPRTGIRIPTTSNQPRHQSQKTLTGQSQAHTPMKWTIMTPTSQTLSPRRSSTMTKCLHRRMNGTHSPTRTPIALQTSRSISMLMKTKILRLPSGYPSMDPTHSRSVENFSESNGPMMRTSTRLKMHGMNTLTTSRGITRSLTVLIITTRSLSTSQGLITLTGHITQRSSLRNHAMPLRILKES